MTEDASRRLRLRRSSTHDASAFDGFFCANSMAKLPGEGMALEFSFAEIHLDDDRCLRPMEGRCALGEVHAADIPESGPEEVAGWRSSIVSIDTFRLHFQHPAGYGS